MAAGAIGFALFDTPLGVCGIAWSENGISRLQLPEATREQARARLMKRVGAEEADPPPVVRDAIERVRRAMTGVPTDFADIPVDLDSVPDFNKRIYDLLRQIGWGETTTYGELAARAGQKDAAQAVGQAMGANPVPVIIPCHRVLAANRKPGGFSAPGGLTTKQRLLELEGVGMASSTPLLPGLFD
jgi:methylated-DNA-[protein]-cysteine S-methyltransferase